MIDVHGTSWKTTSSKKLSLKYKLEEAKLFLRKLKNEKPQLFEKYSMNGDYNKYGHEFANSYYDIIHKADFKNIQRYEGNNNTNDLLRAGNFNKMEKQQIQYLKNIDLINSTNKRRIITNLPKKSGLTPSDLPDNCFYRGASSNKGDYFIVKQNDIVWKTSRSNNVSTIDKYNEMVDYINALI